MSHYELAGLLTHAVVFAVGLGAISGLVPLARGRRSGLGLVLMAASMLLLIIGPGWNLGLAASVGHAVLFFAALWLLIGPVPGKPREQRHQF